MYKIYWIINQHKTKTYVGFSDRLQKRLNEHKNKKVKTTKNFGKFNVYLLEEINTLNEAREKEKYWKSTAGRRKLKLYFNKIINTPPSSSG